MGNKEPMPPRKGTDNTPATNEHACYISIRYKLGCKDLMAQMSESDQEHAAAVASLRAFKTAFASAEGACRVGEQGALGLLDKAVGMALAYLSMGEMRQRLSPAGITYLRGAARALVEYRRLVASAPPAEADALMLAAGQAARTVERIYAHDVRALKTQLAADKIKERLGVI